MRASKIRRPYKITVTAPMLGSNTTRGYQVVVASNLSSLKSLMGLDESQVQWRFYAIRLEEEHGETKWVT